MDSIPSNIKKKKKRNRIEQFIPNTERKASGCNWETYKNLFSKSKTKGNKYLSQYKFKPKSKEMYTTTPLCTVNI